ncbi:alpha/beta hydrolase [Nocardia halotolerans]|uniref:Alpha/beta hydrolase n=1 Tax=Nocardia halotolerans TaxID=1755878 RepID=A0ABV8VML9_9NOCA
MRFGKAVAPKGDRPGKSRTGTPRGWRHRILAVGAAALVLPIAAGAAPTAFAAPLSAPALRAPAGGYEELMVPSQMGPVKVQVQWAKHGGSAALYLLDGMAARDDKNAWSFETNAMQQFENDNVTLVMPVGGMSSFYTDWMAPSNINGQKTTYKWETFLTEELPNFLAGYGVSKTNNGIVGLSMSGSAALSLAALHRDQFKYAGSFSGALNLSQPGMREAVRMSMLRWGAFSADSLAPPWSPQWLRMDPFTVAPQLKGLPMRISVGSGLPGKHDSPQSADQVFNTGVGMGIEAVTLISTRSFEKRLRSIGIPATFDFPATGTHSWKYWEDQLWAGRPQILSALGA